MYLVRQIKPTPSPKCDVTLVTSYFAIESKHTQREYREWIKNLLSLDACMVVVTAPETKHLFTDRPQTKIVEANLTDLSKHLNRPPSFWEGQFLLDREREIHRGYELYWIWALKPLLLHDAARNKSFGSKFYFWIDAGYLRDQTYSSRTLKAVPTQVRMFSRGVFFGMVNDFTKEELVLINGKSNLTWLPDRLSGGLWGGRASSVISFSKTFFSIFNRLADSGYFVGKDQLITNLACIENARLCIVVKPNCYFCNKWFNMVPFLLGDVQDKPFYLTR